MIYYHKKYLEQARRQKSKQSDEEMIRQLNRHCKPEPPKDLFFTGVGIENQGGGDADGDGEGEGEGQGEGQGEVGHQTQEEGGVEVEPLGEVIEKLRSQSVRSMKIPPMRFGRVKPQARGDAAWKKKKRGPRFMLDFRKSKLANIDHSKLEPLEKLKRYYDKAPQPNRETYFIPTLKTKRNPQLQKIETYFVSCSLTLGRLQS